MAVSFFEKNLKIKNIIFKESDTFMNSSGDFAKKEKDYYKVDLNDIYIAHDDLDLKLGEYKIQKGKGPRDHNGVNSIEEALKDTEFWRIRIGVDNRNPEERMNGEEYVLEKFFENELEVLREVFERITNELKKRFHTD